MDHFLKGAVGKISLEMITFASKMVIFKTISHREHNTDSKQGEVQFHLKRNINMVLSRES